jgi:hypothetical protein
MVRETPIIDSTARIELEEAYRNRRGRKVIQVIKLYLKNASPEVTTELTDLFDKMMTINGEYFTDVFYPLWQEILGKLNPNVSYVIDKQMVEFFSVRSGSSILAESHARVEENFGKIKHGRVFVLPDRIIASGRKTIAPKGYSAMGAGGVGYAMNLSKRIHDAIDNRFGYGFRLKYGYAYPLKGATIEYANQNVILVSNEFGDSDKKRIKLELRIMPLQTKGQSRSEFESVQDKVLDTIVNLVKQNHP